MIRTTSGQREFPGWFGSAVWLFFMMYGYDHFVNDRLVLRGDGVEWPQVIFAFLFAVSVAFFSWRYGDAPDRLSAAAFYLTPVAIAFAAVFVLLPQPAGTVLYMVSPVFMAPALTRRVYGVIRTAGPGRRLTRYMSGIAACVILFTVWIIIKPPREIAFLVPALLAVFSWAGVRLSVPLPEELPESKAVRFTKKNMAMMAATVAALFWLDLMANSIRTNILAIGDENEGYLLLILGFIIPPAGFILYAVISDKGHERTGFICGIALFLIGIQLAFLPGWTQNVLVLLTVTEGLGGTYTEFFILTTPLFFLAGAKRPVFIASFGVFLNLVSSCIGMSVGGWLPRELRTLGTPVLVSASVSAVVFIALVYILFISRREKTLAASLYALIYGAGGDETSGEQPRGPREQAGLMDSMLAPEEKKVALLLIEGGTQRDISRRLKMPAAEVSRLVSSIRDKVVRLDDPDPVVAAAADKYRLTRRETEILRCLRRDMTNHDIAEELFLSEATVKIHVHNLLNKLNIETRRQLPEWAEAFGRKV